MAVLVRGAAALERLSLALWAGMTWTTGYVVAPTLFTQLNPAEAGRIAGALFSLTGWLALALLAGFLALRGGRRGRHLFSEATFWAVLAAIVLVLINQLLLQPMMTAARDAASGLSFGALHGLSQVVYLLVSLLAAGAVVGQSRASR